MSPGLRADAPQGLLLTIVPWVLKIYGPRIRARSKIASVGGSRPLQPRAEEDLPLLMSLT